MSQNLNDDSPESEVKYFLIKAETDFNRLSVVTPELLQLRRSRIMDLEDKLKTVPGSYGMAEFNEGKITHHFGTGVYGRELFIPAGNVIVSQIHKNKTFNIIAKGKIKVICPHKGANTYQGPFCFVSEPMTKRIVIAFEDTLWITAHANENDTEDLEEIQSKTIATNFDEETV